MAIGNSDGSIVLTTRVDTSGLSAGLKGIKTNTKSVSTGFGKLGAAITAAFSVKAIIDFSKQSSQLATQTEASVQRLVDIYGAASESVGNFIDENARSLGMSKAAAASFSSVYGNLFSVWADQQTNANLTNQYLQMTAVVASKTGRTVEDVQERIRSGLLGNTEAIEDLGVFVNVKTIEMTDAFQRMANGKSWEQLDAYTQQQIRSMAILEQATSKYGTEVAETSATVRNQYKAAYEDFQATWGEVVNVVLIPALKVLTQFFNIATKGLQVIAGISGKTIEQKDNVNETTKNQKKLTKEIEKTAEAQEKTLAGFDELNILSSKQESSSSETADANNFNTLNVNGNASGNNYVEEIDQTLATIMGIVALALVAVGLILLFTGNIGYGIGFIIAGAFVFAVTVASVSGTTIGSDVIQLLTTIMGIAGGALLAIGIMLLWIGGVVGTPIAVGMIIAGAALIVGAVATQAALAPSDIESWLSLIMGIAGGAMLALGVILCMLGSVPVGVGLIIAGALALVGAFALNSNAIVEAIKGPLGIIMGIVGAALLTIGIILCCTGVALPLGIALIAAGAISLVAVVALNWNAIVDKIKEIIGAVVNWIKTYGLLVLGIILCLTGAGIPLGIALIIQWAKTGVKNGVPLANAIVDFVKKIWQAVKNFWNKYIAPVFTGKFWLNLAKKCANGLISGFESAVNGIIWLFESLINFVVKGLNFFIGKLSNVTGTIGDLIGINLRIPLIPEAQLGRVKIPRLARGAVIPPNKEFMAVLGDQKHGRNLEAPEDLIRQIVKEETQRPTNFTVKATGSMAQLIRLLNLEITEEQNRASVF